MGTCAGRELNKHANIWVIKHTLNLHTIAHMLLSGDRNLYSKVQPMQIMYRFSQVICIVILETLYCILYEKINLFLLGMCVYKHVLSFFFFFFDLCLQWAFFS